MVTVTAPAAPAASVVVANPTYTTIPLEIAVDRPAAEVWAFAGDPARLHEWFPGIVACTVEGRTRVITTGAGLSLPEELLVVDDLQRRLLCNLGGFLHAATLFARRRPTIASPERLYI